MTREEEYKVDLSHLDAESAQNLVLQALDELELEIGSQIARSQISLYFDSIDRALGRLDIGLRFRYGVDSGRAVGAAAETLTAGRWCLKLPSDAARAVSSVIRDEFEIDGTGSGPPRQFFLALDYVLGGLRPLVPLASIHTERTSLTVAEPGAVAEAEVDVDVVSILEPSPGHFVEVEIEARQSAMSKNATALFDWLLERGGRPCSASKLERALFGSTNLKRDEDRVGASDEDYRTLLGLKVRLGAAHVGPPDEIVWNSLELVARLMAQGEPWNPPRSLLVVLGEALARLLLPELRLGSSAVQFFSSADAQQWVATLCDVVVDCEELGHKGKVEGRLSPLGERTNLGLSVYERCLNLVLARSDVEVVRAGYCTFLQAYFEIGSSIL